MNEEQATNGLRRRWLLHYGFAVVGSGVGVAASALLAPNEDPIYALLVGVVAVAIWYGGLGPGLTAVVVGWGLELLVLYEDERVRGLEMTRWPVTLAIALSVIWVSVVIRLRSERAASATSDVEASFHDMARLQELSATLSAAVTPSDVAQALVARTPSLIGARGAALGLVDGSDLVIVDPRVAGSTHEPGIRLPLATRAPIAQAASEGRTILVGDRTTFERDFPDGAALTLYAHRAIAVPLMVAGESVGALSLLFDESGSAHSDAEEIAELAAGLGGQALERARLYERERESRAGLDRILRVAPSFRADDVESATTAICREAAATFGADTAILWRLREQRLELVCTAPAELLPSGLEASLEDFPTLREAVEDRRVSFVSDVHE